MKTRYYADADIREWHEHTLGLLRTLHDEHDITVEIDRIDEQHGPITDFPSEVRYSSPEEVYERDLKRNRDLNQTIDPTRRKHSNGTDHSTSSATSRSSMTREPFSGPQCFPAMLTDTDRVPNHRQPWTFWKTLPLLRAIGSVSSVFTCWTVARRSVRTVATNFRRPARRISHLGAVLFLIRLLKSS